MIIRIMGDTSSYSTSLQRATTETQDAAAQVQAAAEKIEQSGKEGWDKLGEAATGAMGALAAFGAANFLRNAMNSFADIEQQQLKLSAAIRAGGHSVDSVAPAYERFTSSLRQEIGASFSTTRSLLTRAEAMGISGAAAENLTRNAYALAAATGTEAESQIMNVRALQEGNAHMLARIPALRGIHDPAEKLAKVQQFINTGMGIAKEQMNSTSGVMSRLQASTGMLTKQFGQLVAEALVPVMKFATEVIVEFSKFEETTKKIIVSAAIVAASLLSIGPAVAVVKNWLVPIANLIVSGFALVHKAILSIIPSIVSFVASLITIPALFLYSSFTMFVQSTALGIVTTASFLYTSALRAVYIGLSLYNTLMWASTLPALAIKYTAYGLIITTVATYRGVLSTIAIVQATYNSMVAIASVVMTTLAAVFSFTTLKTIAYGLAYAPVILAKFAYLAVLGIVQIATATWAVITAIASGGLSILAAVVIFAAIVIAGVFVAAITAAISPLIGFAGAIASVVGVIGGVAAVAGLAQLVTFAIAMVQAFNDKDIGKPMKDALVDIWNLIKRVGAALSQGFGVLNVGDSWRDMMRLAQQFFLSVTRWIQENSSHFLAWGYYVGQIGRTIFDAIASVWQWFMGIIGSALGFVTDNAGGVLNTVVRTITNVLAYISTGMKNLDLVWDIVVAGFKVAWAKVTTMSQWVEWFIRAKIIFEDLKSYVVEAFYKVWTEVQVGFIRIMPRIQAAFFDMLAGFSRGLASSEFADMLGLRVGIRAQAESFALDARRLRQIGSPEADRQAQQSREAAETARLARLEEFNRTQVRLQEELRVAQQAGDRGAIDIAQAELNGLLGRMAALVETNLPRISSNQAAQAGQQAGSAFNGAMRDELKKLDATSFFSAEATSRIRDYMTNLGRTAAVAMSGAAVPGMRPGATPQGGPGALVGAPGNPPNPNMVGPPAPIPAAGNRPIDVEPITRRIDRTNMLLEALARNAGVQVAPANFDRN